MTSDRSENIKNIGVIGAGQMGSGIAHVCALAGYQVRLTDVDAAALDNAVQVIDRNLTRQVGRGVVSDADKNAAMRRIKTGAGYEMFGDCEVVIEAATEKEEIKREIFKKLVPMLKSDAIIASNTSSISITRLAASTDRPDRFIGMHFMNPVPVMALVELIRGIATDEKTFATVRDLAIHIGKKPVAAEDFKCGTSFLKISRFTSSRSVAASMTKSQSSKSL